MILPQPSASFQWLRAGAGDALVCPELLRSARHVFTTRPWPLGSVAPGVREQAWTDVAQALDVAPHRLLRLRQVHGAEVVVQKAGHEFDERTEADIVVTDDPGIALAVRTADCVPLLVADARSGPVAAAHAGWRGLVLRVPSVTVAALGREFGSRPADLVAAIGPSIGPCCYEIGNDVRSQFKAAGFPPSELTRWFGAEPKASPANPSFAGLSTDRRPGHLFLDIWSVARDQLVAAGVPPHQIHVAELCTASHPTAFCSYRRDGSRAGRLAAAIRKT